MKKTIVLTLIIVSTLSAKKFSPKFRLGGNSSMIVENGNIYPVFGLTAGFYPIPYFFVEGTGEYIVKSNASELVVPVTLNATLPTRYVQPYLGAGLSYRRLQTETSIFQSVGARTKIGLTLFDTKGASGAFELTYDVPDVMGSRGRWQFTGRIDKNFNLAF